MSDNLFDDDVERVDGDRELELLTIHNIMKLESGRMMFYRMLQQALVFENIFDNDVNLQYYNTGKRAAGLMIDANLRKAAPDEYLKMIKENMNG